MSWVDCVIDNDYEIFTEYPHQIRRKSNKRIVAESITTNGYIQCKLNNRNYRKHRIIAIQFIPNPDNLPDVDHIDRNRQNNHISNLQWVNNSSNQKNKSSHKGYQYVFLDELPETAEPLDSYNGYDLDGIFVDYEEKKLYLFNGRQYRELIPCRNGGSIYYSVQDIQNKRIKLYHEVLFG